MRENILAEWSSRVQGLVETMSRSTEAVLKDCGGPTSVLMLVFPFISLHNGYRTVPAHYIIRYKIMLQFMAPHLLI